jgi:acyl carrier protein
MDRPLTPAARAGSVPSREPGRAATPQTVAKSKGSILMPTDTAIVNLVAETLRVDVDKLTPQTRFDDLGRTSVQEIELFTQIEDTLDVKLDFEAFSTLATVGELVDAVTVALRSL